MPKVSLYRNRVPLKLGHKHSQGRYSRLEPDEGKLSRPVLKGRGREQSRFPYPALGPIQMWERMGS